MGAFAGHQPNAGAMIGVMSMHRAAVGNIEHSDSVPSDLLSAARRSWDDALDLGEVAGYRNAQATVLAPTGTISFMMDCDTTGVEPDFSLVKMKKLVGGGDLTIVNKTVPMALDRLGYAPEERDQVVAFIDDRGGVVGAPHLKTEHYPVFDCAIGERAIHHMGHVKMMGAVQPFISGAISKTVNLPEETTVDEVSQLLVDSWKLGVKAIAIYRDNCKVAQPLSKKSEKAAPPVPKEDRRRLPDDRTEIGRKFRVGDYEGYIHVGLYDDGTPGDIFVDIAKEGTTLAGLMNSFMISVSLGLQYGVPLEVYVSQVRAHALRAERPHERRGHPRRQVPRRLHLPLDGQEVPRHGHPAGARHPQPGGPSAPGAGARHPGERWCGGRGGGRAGAPARPDGPVQCVRGRRRVRQVRRPDGEDRELLHVPRLRSEHRL